MPDIKCPSAISVELGTPKAITAAATDASGTHAVSCAPDNTAGMAAGTRSVVCTATDNAGLEATCNVDVTVTGAPPGLSVEHHRS